jgi:DNA ligase-1
MNDSSSGNYKIETIKKHSDSEFLQKIFNYTYNPYKKYNVTSKNCKKNSELLGHANTYGSIFTLLDDLANRVCTGHNAIANVNRFILENIQYEDLIFNIIDRDLKMGASTSSINKVIPGCIPTFKVALANPYNVKRVDFKSGDWYGSRKLDGVRCICRKENDIVTFFSRSGKEFLTLGNLENEILKISGNFILDGEICMVDKDGNEDFQGIMKQIRKKDHQIEKPKFFVFDYLTLEQFDNQTGVTPLTFRLEIGKKKLQMVNINSDMLEFLPQEQLTTEEQFTEMAKDAEEAGFEGIMVRKNVGYEGKRSHNLLKVKKFHDAEYTVLGTTNAFIRWTENGKQVERECLSNITIEHKGCKVNVGSGFSKEQREMYFESPQDIIGKTVTIQYFEESKNQNGGYSLRFPVLKHVYTNGRDC